MHRLNSCLFKNMLLMIFCFSLVSCSAMNFFKSSAGDMETKESDSTQISQLESKLIDLKQELADLKHLTQKKDSNILILKRKNLSLKKKISVLEKNVPKAKPVQYKVEYTSPPVLYKKARNLLIEENYKNAASLFTEFIKNHPKHSLADNAVYWLAECYYSLGDYKKAISIFKDLEINYPKSEKIPDSILKLGYSYLSLDDTNRANHHLTKVLKKYPFSPAAEKAQEKLKSFE